MYETIRIQSQIEGWKNKITFCKERIDKIDAAILSWEKLEEESRKKRDYDSASLYTHHINNSRSESSGLSRKIEKLETWLSEAQK